MEKIIPTISLSTIHGFKGMEADRVILIDSLTQRTMDAFSVDPDSEYRVFYVGATRAKICLNLITGDNCLITPMIYANEGKDRQEHFGYNGKRISKKEASNWLKNL
jgi:superfamily I DNA/RNA helicase